MEELIIAGIIGGISGFVTASWADHIAFFFPFGYWQWKLKLWLLQWNPNCKNLKDTKFRQKLAWKLSADSQRIEDTLNKIMD